jgi:aconitate hydratase
LQFKAGDTAKTLGLSGEEVFEIIINDDMQAGVEISVTAKDVNGVTKNFMALSRIDTGVELKYFRDGGILRTVLKNLAKAS